MSPAEQATADASAQADRDEAAEIETLRHEIVARLGRLHVRRDQAAMAFRTAEEAHHRAGSGETFRALEAARVARREASDAVDREQA